LCCQKKQMLAQKKAIACANGLPLTSSR